MLFIDFNVFGGLIDFFLFIWVEFLDFILFFCGDDSYDDDDKFYGVFKYVISVGGV